MSDISFSDEKSDTYALNGMKRINIILGRNGSGKSRLLRSMDKYLAAKSEYRVSYVTPERTGTFQRDANVEANGSNLDWIRNIRRANQTTVSFKAMSHQALRNAETSYLRKLQDIDARGKSFQVDCLGPINRMLSNVFIEQGGNDFMVRSMEGHPVNPNDLSSGESETIALAAEVMSFLMGVDPSKDNVLLLDEPDVHQHPDLQARFGHYLLELLHSTPEATRSRIFIHIATHSTPLVCALASSDLVTIGTKEFSANVVTLRSISSDLKKIAPFFGHPLSLSLSNDPLLVLEGEDDERVWQQAARSSLGDIRVFPVLAQSVDQQFELEALCDKMLTAISDSPKAYSLRDGDGVTKTIDNIGCVRRFRLQCYAIENALVTSECLAILGVSWEDFKKVATAWIKKNSDHQDVDLLTRLLAAEDRLRHTKIKAIRQLIVSVAGLKKPWEVVVGQALASIVGKTPQPGDQFALTKFISEGAAKGLLQSSAPQTQEK